MMCSRLQLLKKTPNSVLTRNINYAVLTLKHGIYEKFIYACLFLRAQISHGELAITYWIFSMMNIVFFR